MKNRPVRRKTPERRPIARALKDAARRLRKPFGLMNAPDRRLAVGLVGSKRAECNSALRRQPSPAPSPLDKSVQTSQSPQGLRRETESEYSREAAVFLAPKFVPWDLFCVEWPSLQRLLNSVPPSPIGADFCRDSFVYRRYDPLEGTRCRLSVKPNFNPNASS